MFIVMRKFTYTNPDFIKVDTPPQLVENNPCYEPSVYDSVMYEEDENGSIIQCDMTQILLHQEKYRRLLGEMNVQNIIAQMHPTQTTVMDNMSDEERFACVISRHCQTLSERQAVLQQLANEHSELSAYAEAMLAENKAAPSLDSASASES